MLSKNKFEIYLPSIFQIKHMYRIHAQPKCTCTQEPAVGRDTFCQHLRRFPSWCTDICSVLKVLWDALYKSTFTYLLPTFFNHFVVSEQLCGEKHTIISHPISWIWCKETLRYCWERTGTSCSGCPSWHRPLQWWKLKLNHRGQRHRLHHFATGALSVTTVMWAECQKAQQPFAECDQEKRESGFQGPLNKIRQGIK